MKTIVIIDDDMDMRDGLRAWLSFQYRILLFSDAGSFLNDLTAIAECDCLLLDLRMPGMNGADLQRELNDREFSAPIVFMSGDAQKADIILSCPLKVEPLLWFRGGSLGWLESGIRMRTA